MTTPPRRPHPGRPPRYASPKRQRMVNLTDEAWWFVGLYAASLDISDSEAIERLLRSHMLWRGDATATEEA